MSQSEGVVSSIAIIRSACLIVHREWCNWYERFESPANTCLRTLLDE